MSGPTIGEMMRSAREHANLTLEQAVRARFAAKGKPLAEPQWDALGPSLVAWLSQTESGMLTPRDDQLEEYAVAYGLARVPDAWYAAAGHTPLSIRSASADPKMWMPIRILDAVQNGSNATFEYTNHRGETAIRNVRPHGLTFGETTWHTKQWLLDAFCFDRNERRSFAVKDIRDWSTYPPTEVR